MCVCVCMESFAHSWIRKDLNVECTLQLIIIIIINGDKYSVLIRMKSSLLFRTSTDWSESRRIFGTFPINWYSIVVESRRL